jgi:hypothetical protein
MTYFSRVISAQQCVIVKVPAVGTSLLHERKGIAMLEGSCGNSPVVISGFEFLPDEEAGVRGDFALYMDVSFIFILRTFHIYFAFTR